MKGILVCVDYADYLAITLPWNRHHFGKFVVVTTHDDEATHRIAQENEALVFSTDAFYEDGADFNKWKALEQGLDVLGRTGVIAILDADILWPKGIEFWTPTYGKLYTPLRRMCRGVSPEFSAEAVMNNLSLFPLHPQQREWAGYTQIFHGGDKVLGEAPWHETNWRHAGGADSFFQAKWADGDKLRPRFEVLHLGESGRNWCGRATPYIDGTVNEKSGSRMQSLRDYIRGRKQGPNRFDGEKVAPRKGSILRGDPAEPKTD